MSDVENEWIECLMDSTSKLVKKFSYRQIECVIIERNPESEESWFTGYTKGFSADVYGRTYHNAYIESQEITYACEEHNVLGIDTNHIGMENTTKNDVKDQLELLLDILVEQEYIKRCIECDRIEWNHGHCKQCLNQNETVVSNLI